jgi:hypothetical protein
MSGSLKRKIRPFISEGTLREDIEDSIISNHLPGYIQYACSFWVHRLERSAARLKDNDQIHRFLHKHLLHWLEALSLSRKVHDAILMLSSLQNMLKVSTSWCILIIDAKGRVGL